MNPITHFIVILLPFLLLIFWMWMFSDMINNTEISRNLKTQWLVAFILFNVLTAIFYYVTVYSKK